ncbi:response regulator transcription factor [bacterium]|nr:response regulator transcription factor [bacterium]
MIKILIAEDHKIFREGVKQILCSTFGTVKCDEASTKQKILDCVLNNQYDTVLLDLSIANGSGLEVIKQIKAERPKLPILALSSLSDDRLAFRALKARAAGVLTKLSTPDELVEAIHRVAQGRKYVTPFFTEKLAWYLEVDEQGPPHKKLSDREYQIMCMIASGKPVKKISEDLSLSAKTVSTYRARMLNKLQLKNNAEVTYYAIKQELVN